jgi:zona occludens toxin
VSITLLTGAPGHGKSYRLVREIERAVVKGEPVGTNVPLREDWPEVMAKRHTAFGRWRPGAVAEKAAEYARQVLVSNDFDELLRVRLHGEGEDRGLLVLDECQRWMNARGWDNALGEDGKPIGRVEALQKRLRVINHLSGHRHYGWRVLLATQSEGSIDNQARTLYEFHTETRNLAKLPFLSIFLRKPLFLVVTRWNDRAKTKAGVETYGLSKSLAGLYHTHALQVADWPADPIMLPRPAPGDEQTPGQRRSGTRAANDQRRRSRRGRRTPSTPSPLSGDLVRQEALGKEVQA